MSAHPNPSSAVSPLAHARGQSDQPRVSARRTATYILGINGVSELYAPDGRRPVGYEDSVQDAPIATG